MTPPPALLEVRSIRRRFGGLIALDDVSFSMAAGRIKAVIGPNGAGKTTLFNIVSGLLPPESGEVLLNGTRVTGLKPFQIAHLGISRTFQTLSLFPGMTALENVMVGRHGRTRRGVLASCLRLAAQQAEERAILQSARQNLDYVGLHDAAEVPVSALSFGRRRMVELARALATEPRLLMLDEPASGLNTRETDELAGLIRKIRDGGVTVLLVEHDMSLVMEISDEIVVLDYGRKIAEGSPAAMRNNPKVIEVYLGGEISVASN